MAIDDFDNKWICTGSGLVKFDGNNWKVFTESNSGLPYDLITTIAIDKSGNKWIGTFNDSGGYGLLVMFDDSTWNIYSYFRYDYSSIVIDDNDNKWIGTNNNGLVKFDGNTWTVYNTSNSGLPYNGINSIAIDDNSTKWIATWNGLAKFNGSDWTVYNTANSGLPANGIHSISIDNMDNKWIGTESGLVKFDGINWTVYADSNSGLPGNYIGCVNIDDSGNKWIGTLDNGLVVYKGGGIVSVHQNNLNISSTPQKTRLNQNYPNPFNPSTTIEFTLPKSEFVELKVYNILGKEVVTLVSNKLNQGNHTYQFDGKNLASGIYYYQLTAGNYRQVKKMIFLK